MCGKKGRFSKSMHCRKEGGKVLSRILKFTLFKIPPKVIVHSQKLSFDWKCLQSKLIPAWYF